MCDSYDDWIDEVYLYLRQAMHNDLNLPLNSITETDFKQIMSQKLLYLIESYTDKKVIHCIPFIQPEKLKYYIDVQVSSNTWTDNLLRFILRDFLVDQLYMRMRYT